MLCMCQVHGNRDLVAQRFELKVGHDSAVLILESNTALLRSAFGVRFPDRPAGRD